MPRSLTILLPVPPSLNNLYPGRGRRHKSKEYKAWIAAADAYYLTQKRKTVALPDGAYTLSILVPQDMRGDVSNRIKAIEDWLVSRELTPNDRKAEGVAIRRGRGLVGHIEVTATSET